MTTLTTYILRMHQHNHPRPLHLILKGYNTSSAPAINPATADSTLVFIDMPTLNAYSFRIRQHNLLRTVHLLGNGFNTCIGSTCVINELMVWIGDEMGVAPAEDQMRIATWNVGGGLLSTTSLQGQLSKLDVVISFMEARHVGGIAITEAGCTLYWLQRNLPKGYKAFGHSHLKLVFWILSPGWSASVEAGGTDQSGRVVAIRMAGRKSSKQLLVGVYGIAGANSGGEALVRQKEVLNRVSKLMDKRLRKGEGCVLAGDLNQAMRSRDSSSCSTSSLQLIQQVTEELGLVSAFIHRNGHISRKDGAYTFERGAANSLIDHIFMDREVIIRSAIDDEAFKISDHKPILADFQSVINKPVIPGQRPALPDQIFDHWFKYDLQALRSWSHEQAEELEMEMLSKVQHGCTQEQLDVFWSRIKALLRQIEVASVKNKSVSRTHRKGDREAILCLATVSRWKKTVEMVQSKLEKGCLTSSDYVCLQKAMWGGRSRAQVRAWMASWKVNEPEKIQLPRVQILEGDEDKERKICIWQDWIRTVRDRYIALGKLQKKRTTLWWKWRVREAFRQRFKDCDEGLTSSIFAAIFPDRKVQESCSIRVGDDLITAPAQVAEEVKRHYHGLSAESEWNRPYEPTHPKSTIFLSGPWKGCDRSFPDLQRAINSGRCTGCKSKLQDTLKIESFEEFLTRMGKKGVESAAGLTGLSYAIMRCLPVTLQKILWHLRNLVVVNQMVPDGLTDLPIIALPKANHLLAGYTNTRPISLYETVFKLITGSIHDKVGQILQEEKVLHPRQFFGKKGVGVTNALHMIFHSLELLIRSGKKVVVKSADVAAAFPSVRHWYLKMLMNGYDFPDGVTRFFLLADSTGRFCIRLRDAWSSMIRKPSGGIGQGEQGSPQKYALVVDVLLWLLEKHKEKGIWVGAEFVSHCQTFFPHLTPVVAEGWLVAFLFADDLCLISGEYEDMQELIDITAGFHDFQGSRLVPYKSYAGSSVLRPSPALQVSISGCEYSNLIKTIREWSASHSKAVQLFRKGSVIHVEGVDKLLNAVGDPVWRMGIRGKLSNTNTLLGKLEELGWKGQLRVLDKPLHILDVRTGRQDPINWVGPTQSFRELGIQLSPGLQWDTAWSVLNNKIKQLMNLLGGALRRRVWRASDILLAHDGKVGGRLIFDASLIPIPMGYYDAWDKQQARIMSEALNLPKGISHDQLFDQSALGGGIRRLKMMGAVQSIVSHFAQLNGATITASSAFGCLESYRKKHGMNIFPLAIPTHTLEPRKKDPLDVRWDVLRMQCTWLRISMDFNTSRELPCPWQLVLPEKSRDERVRVTELRSLMRDVCRWRSLAMAQCLQGKLVGPIRSHKSQKLIQALRRWTLDRHWPSWRQTDEVKALCEIQPVNRDTQGDPEDTTFVSDGTVWEENGNKMSGFTMAVSHHPVAVLGRCNWVGGTSFEAESMGILAGITARNTFADRGLNHLRALHACDNIGALIKVLKVSTSARSEEQLSVMRCPPIWKELQVLRCSNKVPIRINEELLHVKAHVANEEISDGSITHLQDECDKLAVRCREVAMGAGGEFFESDLKLGLFDCTQGFRPGDRKRVLEPIRQWLSNRAVTISESEELLHPDGTHSWRDLRSIEWGSTSKFLHSRCRHECNSHKFVWQDGGVVRSDSQKVFKDSYGRLKGMMIQLCAGRFFTRSRFLSAEDVMVHGKCILCRADFVDNQFHVFQCKGDAIQGMPEALLKLHRNHMEKWLQALAEARHHGLLDDRLRAIPERFKMGGNSNSSTKSETLVLDILSRKADDISNSMYWEMRSKEYKRELKAFTFLKKLHMQMEENPQFRAPFRISAQTREKDLNKPPEKPSKPSEPKVKMSNKDSHSRDEMYSVAGHTLNSRRFRSIWVETTLDDKEFEQHFTSALSTSPSTKGLVGLVGSMIHPLLQDLLARWLGVQSSLIIAPTWKHIWDIPLVHVQEGRIHDADLTSDCTTGLGGIFWEQKDLLEALRMAKEAKLEKAFFIVQKNVELLDMQLEEGWSVTKPLGITVYPLCLPAGKESGVLILARLLTKNIGAIPEFVKKWPLIVATDSTSAQWEITAAPTAFEEIMRIGREADLVLGLPNCALKQGMQAGLLPCSLLDSWGRTGMKKKAVQKLYMKFCIGRLNLAIGLSGLRNTVFNVIVDQNHVPEMKPSLRGGGEWTGAEVPDHFKEAFAKETHTAEDYETLSVPKARKKANQIKEQLLSFADLFTEVEEEVSCACGRGTAWLCTGLFSVPLSKEDSEDQWVQAKCKHCREEAECANMPIKKQCLHCLNCGSGLHVSRLFYTPSKEIVCMGCAEWHAERWPRRLAWHVHNAGKHVRGMIRAAAKWWLEDCMDEDHIHRVATGLLRFHLPVNWHGLPLNWGWIFAKMSAILTSIGYTLAKDKPPHGCEVLHTGAWEVDHGTSDEQQFWARQCNWMHFSVPRTSSNTELKQGWNSLWNSKSLATRKNHLMITTWQQVADCDSEPESVEGGEIQSNESKVCQFTGCTLGSQQDAYDSEDSDKLDLFLCDGCNRGYHMECIKEANAIQAWGVALPIKGPEPWFCRDCSRDGTHRPRNFIEVAKQGERRMVVVRWLHKHGPISMENLEEVMANEGAAQLLEDFHLRMHTRKRNGQDEHGKLLSSFREMKPLRKNISRGDDNMIVPGSKLFNKAVGQMEAYHIWLLRHPSSRIPIRYDKWCKWQGAVIRHGRGDKAKKWLSTFTKWIQESIAWSWFSSAIDEELCAGVGMEAHDFLDHIDHEIKQWEECGTAETLFSSTGHDWSVLDDTIKAEIGDKWRDWEELFRWAAMHSNKFRMELRNEEGVAGQVFIIGRRNIKATKFTIQSAMRSRSSTQIYERE